METPCAYIVLRCSDCELEGLVALLKGLSTQGRSVLPAPGGFLGRGRVPVGTLPLHVSSGNDVVGRMAQEVVRGANVMRLQFLASGILR
jgi:hypothetical protein